MSLIKSNSIQIGQSSTATQNFTLSVPSSPDGTIKLARGNSGATTADIFSVSGSGAITGATISGATINSSTVNGGSITLGTSQNTTSGTAIDFTGIPSWAKKVTVMLNGVSTSGASQIRIRVGSGSVSTSGYIYYGAYSGAGSAGSSSTDGANVDAGTAGGSAYIRNGILTIVNISGNTWLLNYHGGFANGADIYGSTGGGSISLSGSLDRVRITTVNGTDTFDAGSVNIMYEG